MPKTIKSYSLDQKLASLIEQEAKNSGKSASLFVEETLKSCLGLDKTSETIEEIIEELTSLDNRLTALERLANQDY
jgi:hypothetical protein